MLGRLIDEFVELFAGLAKGGAQILLLGMLVVLGVTVIIRMGVFIREIFMKKTSIPFRTTLSFRKWLEFSMDLFIIGVIVLTLVGEISYRHGSTQEVTLFLVSIGIRIALYFAIRAEEKKK
jgi:hypothetical protein